MIKNLLCQIKILDMANANALNLADQITKISNKIKSSLKFRCIPVKKAYILVHSEVYGELAEFINQIGLKKSYCLSQNMLDILVLKDKEENHCDFSFNYFLKNEILIKHISPKSGQLKSYNNQIEELPMASIIYFKIFVKNSPKFPGTIIE